MYTVGMFGDIYLEVDCIGNVFIQFNERASKTRVGALLDDRRFTRPKISCSCGSDSESCITEVFKAFIQRFL